VWLGEEVPYSASACGSALSWARLGVPASAIGSRSSGSCPRPCGAPVKAKRAPKMKPSPPRFPPSPSLTDTNRGKGEENPNGVGGSGSEGFDPPPAFEERRCEG
jgi:hypothetical protein